MLDVQLVSLKEYFFHDQEMSWRNDRITVNTICEMGRVNPRLN